MERRQAASAAAVRAAVLGVVLATVAPHGGLAAEATGAEATRAEATGAEATGAEAPQEETVRGAATGPATGAVTGPVTGLPLPRYVSLRSNAGNARRGPGMTHRIDWVFARRNMPLRVTAEFEHWRRVEDAEGLGGWMHFALLSGVRHALVLQDMTPLHLQADARAPVVGYMEAGVIARLQDCGPAWCRLRAENLRGWAPKSALWGVEAAELIE